jgi:hypothetical protein
VITESTRIYAGTEEQDTFLIFHDGLSAWWEKEAQAYITMRGFQNRQLRCMGNTNFDTRYHEKLTGDSPEMCRALDSHGFSDLASSICGWRPTSIQDGYCCRGVVDNDSQLVCGAHK